MLHHELIPGTDRGTIVFIHGNSISSRVFDPQFTGNPWPWSRLRIDLPGHGNSPHRQEPDAYSLAAHRNAIRDTLAAVDDDFILVGCSLGGHLAIEVAPELRNLRGLLVHGSPPLGQPLNPNEAFLPSPELAKLFSPIANPDEIAKMFRHLCPNAIGHHHLTADFLRADPGVRESLAAEMATGAPLDEVAILRQLAVPKLVITTADDPFTNNDYILSLDIGLVIVALSEGGHYPSVTCPAEFTAQIQKFAQRVFT